MQSFQHVLADRLQKFKDIVAKIDQNNCCEFVRGNRAVFELFADRADPIIKQAKSFLGSVTLKLLFKQYEFNDPEAFP